MAGLWMDDCACLSGMETTFVTNRRLARLVEREGRPGAAPTIPNRREVRASGRHRHASDDPRDGRPDDRAGWGRATLEGRAENGPEGRSCRELGRGPGEV